MATANFTTQHRPVRIGLLVRAGELADLEAAASISLLLWGGLHNPIIPIRSKIDAASDELVHAFRVDVLYPVHEAPTIKEFAERHRALCSPRLSARELFSEDWHTKKRIPAYLDVLNAIDKYWDQEFKHSPIGTQSECRLVSWEQADPLHVLFGLGFGSYTAALNLKRDFRQAFERGLRASEVKIDPGAEVPEALAGKITPALLSGIDLRGYGGAVHSQSGGVYVGDANDFEDLVNFWNIRASGGLVEFLCLSAAARLDAFIRAHLNRLDSIPQRHPTIEDHIGIFYRNNESAVLDAIKSFPTKRSPLLQRLRGTAGDVSQGDPAMFSFDWNFALGIIDGDRGDYSVTLSLPEKRFLGNARASPTDQLLAVSIGPHGDLGYPGHTLEPPLRPALTEFYGREIANDPWGVRPEPEGIGLFVGTRENTIRMRPVEHAAVIEAIFGEAGLKIRPSAGGRLADRLLEAVGGYEDTRVFKVRGVRNLITNLPTQDTITRGDATKTIWNNGQFKEHERLHIEARKTPDLTVGATFDFLLKHGFFRAGLEFKCDNCGLDSWLSLRQIDDTWACEYCGRANTTSLHIRDRGDWKFRKSGLLAKDNNQEGAIPVILSLLTLGRVGREQKFLRITSIEVVGGASPCEIDFVAIQHLRGETCCAIGEAKAAGGTIDAKDAANLKAIADKLKAIGIRPYIVFAKTADAFSAAETNLFRTAMSDYDLILLTNREMEPYHPYYESDDKDKLPATYAVSFDDMVVNTSFRYFTDPKHE